MKPGWIIGIVMAFVILSIVMGVAENAYISANETSVLSTLGRPFLETTAFGGITAAIGMVFSGEFWGAMWRMLSWDYPAVFYGAWEIVRFVFLIPLSIGFVISIVLVIGSAIASTVSRIVGR